MRLIASLRVGALSRKIPRTAEVWTAHDPWIASSTTCTALSAPIDSALRIASVAESGPTVSTVTSAVRGIFRDKAATRSEAMSLILGR